MPDEPKPEGTFPLDTAVICAIISATCPDVAKALREMLCLKGAGEGVVSMVAMGFVAGRIYQHKNPELHFSEMKPKTNGDQHARNP